MTGPKDLKRHAALVDQMASTLGVDLQEAAITGALRIDDISEAVLRCHDCPHPDQCAAALGAPDTPPDTPLANPPEYCRNTELLQQLRTTTTTAGQPAPPSA